MRFIYAYKSWSWFPFVAWGPLPITSAGWTQKGVDMLNLIIALGFILMASSCATVLDGSSQLVTVNSQPNGVRIFINGAQVGVTPLVTQVKRAKNLTVMAKKDGYQEQQFILQTKTNTYFWFNALFGGAGTFSSTTDWASDAMIEYSPNMYYISLEPLHSSQGDKSNPNNDRKVRTFILRNYAHLTSEIARGGWRVPSQSL